MKMPELDLNHFQWHQWGPFLQQRSQGHVFIYFAYYAFHNVLSQKTILTFEDMTEMAFVPLFNAKIYIIFGREKKTFFENFH